jgi:hypothetical protein
MQRGQIFRKVPFLKPSQAQATRHNNSVHYSTGEDSFHGNRSHSQNLSRGFFSVFPVSFCASAKTADDAVMTCRMKMRAQLKIKFSRKHTSPQKAELHGGMVG